MVFYVVVREFLYSKNVAMGFLGCSVWLLWGHSAVAKVFREVSERCYGVSRIFYVVARELLYSC